MDPACSLRKLGALKLYMRSIMYVRKMVLDSSGRILCMQKGVRRREGGREVEEDFEYTQ